MVVAGPWPGYTVKSSPNGSSFSVTEFRSCVRDVSGRPCVRPIEFWKSTSPVRAWRLARSTKLMESGEWPGVWSTSRVTPPNDTVSPSARNVVGTDGGSTSTPKAVACSSARSMNGVAASWA